MKVALTVLILMICALVDADFNKTMEDSLRVTYTDYSVGFKIYYRSEDWKLDKRKDPTFTPLFSTAEKILVSLWSNKAEKNLSSQQLEERFKNDLLANFPDATFDASKVVKINNIDFCVNSGTYEFQKRERRLSQYTHSDEKGCVAFFVYTPSQIMPDSQTKIQSLLEGFSFDGKACKGNPALRFMKDVLDEFKQQ